VRPGTDDGLQCNFGESLRELAPEIAAEIADLALNFEAACLVDDSELSL